MSNETLRKLLIYLLKKYKVYYINVFDEIVEYKKQEDINNEIDALKKEYILNNLIATANNGLVVGNFTPFETDNSSINNYERQLNEIKSMKALNIKDNYTLEEIASELGKIGEEEDFYYYYKYSKLKELKEIMTKDTKVKLKYIQDTSNKKIG